MIGIQVTILNHTESNCIYSLGRNNLFEQISMHDNNGTALRHYRGGNNLCLNCDAYRNHAKVSEDGLGSNTDGFDIIRADESVLFENCWAFIMGF